MDSPFYSERDVAVGIKWGTRDNENLFSNRTTGLHDRTPVSQARYDGGVVDYIEVIDSERTFFDSELAEPYDSAESLRPPGRC